MQKLKTLGQDVDRVLRLNPVRLSKEKSPAQVDLLLDSEIYALEKSETVLRKEVEILTAKLDKDTSGAKIIDEERNVQFRLEQVETLSKQVNSKRHRVDQLDRQLTRLKSTNQPSANDEVAVPRMVIKW